MDNDPEFLMLEGKQRSAAVARALGAKWKALGEDEKLRYKEEAPLVEPKAPEMDPAAAAEAYARLVAEEGPGAAWIPDPRRASPQ